MRCVSCHPPLPSFSFINVVLDPSLLGPQSLITYLLALAFIGFAMCRLRPSRTAGGCALTCDRRSRTKGCWVCVFTGSALEPVSQLAVGSWARKRRPRPDSSWPFSTKVLCHSYKPSLAAGLSFSSGICTIWGAGFSTWEPLFLYRGNWGFSGSPLGASFLIFLFLIYASGCSRHHLLGCHGLPTHSCLGRGRWNLPEGGNVPVL